MSVAGVAGALGRAPLIKAYRAPGCESLAFNEELRFVCMLSDVRFRVRACVRGGFPSAAALLRFVAALQNGGRWSPQCSFVMRRVSCYATHPQGFACTYCSRLHGRVCLRVGALCAGVVATLRRLPAPLGCAGVPEEGQDVPHV